MTDVVARLEDALQDVYRLDGELGQGSTRRRVDTRLGVALMLMLAARPALAQCPDGTPPPCPGQAARTPAPRSIAVLTFENVTRDTSAQYLAEGLADQIFTRLGSVSRLTLISRTAVRRLRDPEQLSVQQIGRTLNAAYLVGGSLRAAGGRVRVTVEALRAGTGEAVWVTSYDRPSDDLIGLEEAIATEVAAGVAGRLSPQERRALGSGVTANGRAYEQFLRGNVLMARRSTGAMRDAIAAYQAAAAADPYFADAYARLAYAYAILWDWNSGDVTDSLMGLSRDATTRALGLDPRSSDAWMARAYLLTDWGDAAGPAGYDSLAASLAAFRRAIELNPRNAEAWHQYGATLNYFSDSASLDALRHALALDPARAVTYLDVSRTYYLMGLNDRALATADSAVALDSDGPFRSWRTLYRLTAGDTAGAVADARLTPGLAFSPAVLAAIARDTAAVRTMEAQVMQSDCAARTVLPIYLLWTGRREEAVRRFLQCGPSLPARRRLRDPANASLANDPRIQALRGQSDSILARARWR